MAEMVGAAIAGGLAGLVLVALLDPNNRLTHLDAVAIAVGIFAGLGLDRLIRG